MADSEQKASTQYPFDTDQLSKGDTISRETIEHAYSVKYGTKEYAICLMQAVAFVKNAFLARGEIATVHTRRGTIVIDDDTTQFPTNRGRYLSRMRGAVRAHHDMLGADRSKIADAKVLASHDRALEVQGRQLQAVKREEMSVPLKAAQRATPGVIKSGDEE